MTAAESGSTRALVRVAAWAVAAVTLAMAFSGVWVGLRYPNAESWVAESAVFPWISPLVSALLGAIILDRKGSHRVGWLFCLSGLAWAYYHLSIAIASAVAAGHAMPAADLWVWSTTWTSLVAFGCAPILVLFVFPDGAALTSSWRLVFRLAALNVAVGAFAHAFAQGPVEDVPTLMNPWGLPGAAGDFLWSAREIAWPLLLVSGAAGVMSLRQRLRAAGHVERQQIKWLLWAGFVLVVFIAFWGITELLHVPNVAASVSGFVLPLLTMAVGIAILRHRLYDIDFLINRTLVYGTLTAALTVVYFGAVVVFQALLAPFAERSNIAVAVSTLAVAALFRPLRARIQQFIDRRFNRERYNAAAAVGRFSTRLRNEVELDTLGNELLAVVAQTLQPASAGVWLKNKEL